MKLITFIVFFVVLTMHAHAQLLFNQTVYNVNDDIQVTNTALVTGLENGIGPNPSSSAITLGTTMIDLGALTQPGIFTVSFTFADNSRQTFMFAVGSNVLPVTNSLVVSATADNSTADQKNIFKQIVQFFNNNSKDANMQFLKNVGANFCSHNAVNLVHNVSFCIAAGTADGAVPVLDEYCADMTVASGKALLVEFYKELFNEMLAQGIITQDQYNALLVDQLDTLVNIAGIFNADCSAFFDVIIDKLDDGTNKLALLKYEGQVCSSAVAVIKAYQQ